MRVVAALVILLAGPLGAAQHEHHDTGGDAGEGGDVAAKATNVLIDIQSNDVVVGQPVPFTVLLLGDHAEPRAHQDMHFRVLFADRVLFEAPAATGHDYDGLNEFTVAFPSPGPWRAEILDDAGTSLAKLDGWATPRLRIDATPVLTGPARLGVGELGHYTMFPANATGDSILHFYTLFEVHDAKGLVLQAKLHGHNGNEAIQSELDLAFPAPGRYTLTATMFQAATYGPQRTSFFPTTARLVVDVEGQATSPAPLAAPLTSSIRNGTDRPVVATIDPEATVGLETLARLTGRALTKASALRTHVDFTGILSDLGGRVLFHSTDLHESDGVLQLLLRPRLAGDYVWSMVVDGNGTRVDLPFRVQAASRATAHVELEGQPGLTSGVPADLVLRVTRPDGSALAHSEILLQVYDADGRFEDQVKLHTHGDGRFPFTFTPQVPGDVTFRLAAFGLTTEAVDIPLVDLTLPVAPGEPWPIEMKPDVSVADAATQVSPLAIAAAAAVAGGGAFAVRRYWRRRRA